MWANSCLQILYCFCTRRPPVPSLISRFRALTLADNTILNNDMSSSSYSSFAHSNRSGGRGRGRGQEMKNDRERSRGRGGGKEKIDALGRLLTRILRHMATELNLNMRNDGYVKVEDLLKLNLKTFANISLRSHTVDDIKEAVRKDNKQRFSLLEENGELLIRANQGHTVTTVGSESLLKQILSADEVQCCVHGTYKRNLESILESGLKRMKRLHVHFSSGLPTDGEVISGEISCKISLPDDCSEFNGSNRIFWSYDLEHPILTTTFITRSFYSSFLIFMLGMHDKLLC